MSNELKVGSQYVYHSGENLINCHISDINDRKVTMKFQKSGNTYTMSLRRFKSDLNYHKKST